MKTIAITAADLEGVFAVPPLARARDASRSINLPKIDRIRQAHQRGGIKRLIYGW